MDDDNDEISVVKHSHRSFLFGSCLILLLPREAPLRSSTMPVSWPEIYHLDADFCNRHCFFCHRGNPISIIDDEFITLNLTEIVNDTALAVSSP